MTLKTWIHFSQQETKRNVREKKLNQGLYQNNTIQIKNWFLQYMFQEDHFTTEDSTRAEMIILSWALLFFQHTWQPLNLQEQKQDQ